jgi:hypothetical protein
MIEDDKAKENEVNQDYFKRKNGGSLYDMASNNIER